MSIQQLSTQLGDLVNVTDSATRRTLQSSVMPSGVLLQNLGSLLLELGRATMMLRINPASVGFCDNYVDLISTWNFFYIFLLIYLASFQSEAVVNSGPALYISPSGPNP